MKYCKRCWQPIQRRVIGIERVWGIYYPWTDPYICWCDNPDPASAEELEATVCSTVRETSIEAFCQIRDEGLLSENFWRIYEDVYENGPVTVRESLTRLGMETNQSGRFTELRERGVLREVGKRPCRVTGRNVLAWDVTSNLPTDPEPRDNETDQQEESIPESAITNLDIQTIRSALKQLRGLYNLHRYDKSAFGKELVAVCQWLRELSDGGLQ